MIDSLIIFFLSYVTVPFLTVLFAMILTCFFCTKLDLGIVWCCVYYNIIIDHACAITRLRAVIKNYSLAYLHNVMQNIIMV